MSASLSRKKGVADRFPVTVDDEIDDDGQSPPQLNDFYHAEWLSKPTLNQGRQSKGQQRQQQRAPPQPHQHRLPAFKTPYRTGAGTQRKGPGQTQGQRKAGKPQAASKPATKAEVVDIASSDEEVKEVERSGVGRKRPREEEEEQVGGCGCVPVAPWVL